MLLVRSDLNKSASPRQGSKSRGRASVRRRPGGYRPALLALEARLPPGDALLGGLVSLSLLGEGGAPARAAAVPVLAATSRAAPGAPGACAPAFTAGRGCQTPARPEPLALATPFVG